MDDIYVQDEPKADKGALESYEQILSTHHGRTIEFVKFAETKHAALVTFCSLWIAAIAGIIRFETDLPLGYEEHASWMLAPLILAQLISLYSFLPRHLYAYYRPSNASSNLLYFNHVAELGPEEYSREVRRTYLGTSTHSLNYKYLHDLEIQIHAQSKIARRKFLIFYWSASILFTSFVAFLLSPLLLPLMGRVLNNIIQTCI